MIKSGLKWMFLIIGTMIGAGYASGRELWQFFGQESTMAIIIFTVFFIMSTYTMMTISYNQQSIHYSPVLLKLLGKKLSVVYDGMIFLYLFSTTVIMMAGGGASLEAVGIPYWGGVIIISFFLIILFVGGSNGMVRMNVVIIPLLIILLLAVLIKFSEGVTGMWNIDWHHQSNWTSAFTFTALNVLPLAAVIGAVGKELKSKGEIWIASIGSGLLLGVVSFMYNQSLLQVTNDIMLYEIPLFALLKSYPYAMTVIMTVLLWFAIYTTAASGIFGLISRLQKTIKLPLWMLAWILVLCMIPLTTLGFSKLVSVLYPLYGIFNLYFLAAVIIYPILNKSH